jgi:hypothetical protein
VFKAAVFLLGLSALAYGVVEFTSEGQAGPFADSRAPVTALMFAAAVIWVFFRGRHARKAIPWMALVMAIPQPAWVHGTVGWISYLVALVTSFSGALLLYRPGSSAYLAAREWQITAAQVRRLFEERGRDGERLHTVSGIAAILGMSDAAVYQHLTLDQQRQADRPPNDP